MIAENMPILYQNIMFGLPSDFARDVFLWAVDRKENDRNCYVAESFAREAEHLHDAIQTYLKLGADVHGLSGVDSDLVSFIMKRHANYKFGGNQSPAYAQ